MSPRLDHRGFRSRRRYGWKLYVTDDAGALLPVDLTEAEAEKFTVLSNTVGAIFPSWYSRVIIVSEPSVDATRRARTGRSSTVHSRAVQRHNDTPRHSDARSIRVTH